MTEQTFHAKPLCPCPFCGLLLSESIDPKTDKTDGIIHGLPMCEKFNSMTPDEFISAVAKALGKTP